MNTTVLIINKGEDINKIINDKVRNFKGFELVINRNETCVSENIKNMLIFNSAETEVI